MNPDRYELRPGIPKAAVARFAMEDASWKEDHLAVAAASRPPLKLAASA